MWLQLRYEVDDDGNLISMSRSPGTAARPFDRDGARGVASLVGQVKRLHEARAGQRGKLRGATQQLEHMQAVLDNVETDFNVRACTGCMHARMHMYCTPGRQCFGPEHACWEGRHACA